MARNGSKYLRRVETAQRLAMEFYHAATTVANEINADTTSYWHGGKTNAAMKRKSLDLTNALAELRKGYID